MNNITIEFCAEDRARIDRLIAALERKITDECDPEVTAALNSVLAQANNEPAQEPENTAPATSEADAHPVEGVQVFDAPVVEKPVVTVKMSDIQQKVVALSAAGKKAEVKAIVTAYAERVTLIPEDKWNEVFEQLTALEG